MNTNFEAPNKKWKTNNNNTIIYKYIIIGNEKRIIPVGDPPPGTGEKPNPAGLKKYQQMKAPLLKKLSMVGDKERTKIQEELGAEIRPSGNNL